MMHEWIAIHGSHDQRERLSAGVLPFQEFVDALAEVTFRPLSHIAPYQTDGAARMQEQLRKLTGYANVVVTPNDLSVVTRLLPTASAIQWSLVNEIRSIIPSAQVQLRERSLACPGSCGPDVCSDRDRLGVCVRAEILTRRALWSTS